MHSLVRASRRFGFGLAHEESLADACARVEASGA
jgi:hypothetical protein